MGSPPQDAALIFELWIFPWWTCSPHSTTVSSLRSPKHWRLMLYHKLVRDVRVHISSIPLAEQGLSESSCHSEQRSNFDHPLVATLAVFPHDPALCESITVSPVPSRPAILTKSHCGREGIPSARMEALMEHLQLAGVSEEVCRLVTAPRRRSRNLPTKLPLPYCNLSQVDCRLL